MAKKDRDHPSKKRLETEGGEGFAIWAARSGVDSFKKKGTGCSRGKLAEPERRLHCLGPAQGLGRIKCDCILSKTSAWLKGKRAKKKENARRAQAPYRRTTPGERKRGHPWRGGRESIWGPVPAETHGSERREPGKGTRKKTEGGWKKERKKEMSEKSGEEEHSQLCLSLPSA